MRAVMDTNGRQLNDPTPEEIQAACRQIREEHRQRKLLQQHGWEPQSGRPAVKGPPARPAKRLPQ